MARLSKRTLNACPFCFVPSTTALRFSRSRRRCRRFSSRFVSSQHSCLALQRPLSFHRNQNHSDHLYHHSARCCLCILITSNNTLNAYRSCLRFQVKRITIHHLQQSPRLNLTRAVILIYLGSQSPMLKSFFTRRDLEPLYVGESTKLLS